MRFLYYRIPERSRVHTGLVRRESTFCSLYLRGLRGRTDPPASGFLSHGRVGTHRQRTRRSFGSDTASGERARMSGIARCGARAAPLLTSSGRGTLSPSEHLVLT